MISTLASAALAIVAPIAARIGSSALRIIIALLRNGMLRGAEEAMEVGRAIVVELGTDGALTNEQRRSAAFGRIAATLAESGRDLIASQVNLAIELLVQELKLDSLRTLAPKTLK